MAALTESRTLDRVVLLAGLAVLIWAAEPATLVGAPPAVVVPTLTMLAGVVAGLIGTWAVEDPDYEGVSRQEGDVAAAIAAAMVLLAAVYYALGWTEGITWGYPLVVALLALIWLFSRLD